ncbi:MAG TPA: TonB-dependent receptor [Blastocatellia bacterium]
MSDHFFAAQSFLFQTINNFFLSQFISKSAARRLIALLIVSLVGCNSLALASGRGSVEGTVADPQGAKITFARVTLRNPAGVIVYETRTDDEGKFSFSSVAEGRYLLAVEAPGFAQKERTTIEVDSNGAEIISITLEIAAVSDYLVVTPTRTDISSDALGGSVSVIESRDFDRASLSLVSEPLRLIPGLSVVQTAGRGGVTSVFTRGGESDYNKVLIDGVPVNAAGGAFDFAFLTPENLERVEVVRGPRSALFGSDAMTSVVQLFTHRGSTSVPEFELTGEGGSFDYHRETARLSGLRRWFDYSASFGFQSTDNRFENNDYINRSASLNLGFRFSPDADLRITSRFNSNNLGVPGPVAVLFADPDQRQSHKDVSLAAAFNLRTTSRWHQTSRGIYSEFDTLSFDPVAQDLTKPGRPPLPPFSFGPDAAFSFREHQKRAGVHYQSILAFSANNTLTAGIDFEHESAVFTDTSRVSPTRNNFGIYIQDQAAWRERVFLTAGVRLERNTARVPDDLRAALLSLGSPVPSGDVGFGTTANPNVALSVFARPHQESATLGATQLRASFGTAIKEPGLTEAFSPNIFFLGNPDIDPERAISFDVGMSQEFFGRRASVEVNYFDNRFRDVIAFLFDPVTFGPVTLPDGRLTNFVNLERASARGIEAIGAARPTLKLSVRASYTFLRSRLDRASSTNREVGLPLLRRPRHSGAFEISWIDERFDITFDGSLVGRRRDIDPILGRLDPVGRSFFNEGYARVGASGSYRINRNLMAFARAENLLNDDYQEVLGYPAYRLNFRAGLRLRIGGGK